MLVDIFKNMVSRIAADPVKDYEEAKQDATRRIVGCDPVTREKLRAESLEADRAMARIQMSMRRGMR